MSVVAPDNPLLEDSPLPRFDAIRPEHVEPAISRLIAEQRARVAQIDVMHNRLSRPWWNRWRNCGIA